MKLSSITLIIVLAFVSTTLKAQKTGAYSTALGPSTPSGSSGSSSGGNYYGTSNPQDEAKYKKFSKEVLDELEKIRQETGVGAYRDPAMARPQPSDVNLLRSGIHAIQTAPERNRADDEDYYKIHPDMRPTPTPTTYGPTSTIYNPAPRGTTLGPTGVIPPR